ncbi:MAG: uracil phosphoribosyltransferase [Deltaproteobacteria bacterium]|nr:uracil phosphoribosyltransferase [Deltaproteobacteria bacterium]
MDNQHQQSKFHPPEIEHRYGSGVHILSDPLALTLLARLSAKGVVQPDVSRLCTHLYRLLAHTVLAAEFPRRVTATETRMIAATPHGVWTGETLALDTFTVIVALARAGLTPSQITYDFLNEVLDPSRVRQDHLSLGRQTDAAGRVTGALLDAAKIGGSIDDAILLIPDPMGATGTTVSTALGHYRGAVHGRARKVIAMHLIVTPEYLRTVQQLHPEVVVYALRVDRGLSPADVLQTIPGTRWAEERGLNDHHYIVPGAGGLGEVLNNAFV